MYSSFILTSEEDVRVRFTKTLLILNVTPRYSILYIPPLSFLLPVHPVSPVPRVPHVQCAHCTLYSVQLEPTLASVPPVHRAGHVPTFSSRSVNGYFQPLKK